MTHNHIEGNINSTGEVKERYENWLSRCPAPNGCQGMIVNAMVSIAIHRTVLYKPWLEFGGQRESKISFPRVNSCQAGPDKQDEQAYADPDTTRMAFSKKGCDRGCASADEATRIARGHKSCMTG